MGQDPFFPLLDMVTVLCIQPHGNLVCTKLKKVINYPLTTIILQ